MRVLVLVAASSTASVVQSIERARRLAAWLGDLRASGVLWDGGPISTRMNLTRSGGMDVIDREPDAAPSRSWYVLDVRDAREAYAIAARCPELPFGRVEVHCVDGGEGG